MQDSNNFEKYQRRLKERAFWIRLGWILLISGFTLLLLATGGTFFNMPFALVSILDTISVPAIIAGVIFILLLGRLGWSHSKWMDLLFNRLSIVLITVSLILSAIYIHGGLGLRLDPVDYAQIMLIIGIILAVLGIRFQSQF